jgi:sulfur transfer protein SufE
MSDGLREMAVVVALDVAKYAKNILSTAGLDTHVSQQRSNGLFAMVERIRADARAAQGA